MLTCSLSPLFWFSSFWRDSTWSRASYFSCTISSCRYFDDSISLAFFARSASNSSSLYFISAFSVVSFSFWPTSSPDWITLWSFWLLSKLMVSLSFMFASHSSSYLTWNTRSAPAPPEPSADWSWFTRDALRSFSFCSSCVRFSSFDSSSSFFSPSAS